MPTIQVSAAIIIKDGQVFAIQRGYGEFKGWWEFTGGKIEAGECPQEALKREIREELSLYSCCKFRQNEQKCIFKDGTKMYPSLLVISNIFYLSKRMCNIIHSRSR